MTTPTPCDHDANDKDTAIHADGLCPYCLQRDLAAAQEKIAQLEEELGLVLADWNALIRAIGSPTNGAAIGYAKALNAQSNPAALDEARALNEQLTNELEAAQEALSALRLFVAETGDKLTDQMYSSLANREGLAIDCKHAATGEVCMKYLDVKHQTDRAIAAEKFRLKVHQILLPDPYDERDVSAAWQVKAIRAAIDAIAEGKP